MPLWCWRYCSGHVGAALRQRGREPSRQTGETRQPVEIRCGRGIHSSWMATPRCRTAVARYASMVDLRAGDAPAWARMRHGARSTGGGGESTGCAKRPIAGVVDIAYGRRRPRETSGTFAGHEGTEKASCIEAETVVAFEVVAVAREAIPCRTVIRHRNRDTIGAEQEAGGPCRFRHAAVAASDGRATASRGFTQQCGSESSSSKDGGSPSNTNPYAGPVPLTRRRARSIPRAPHRPPMRLPASRAAAVRGPSLTGLIHTPSLTRSAGDPAPHPPRPCDAAPRGAPDRASASDRAAGSRTHPRPTTH